MSDINRDKVERADNAENASEQAAQHLRESASEKPDNTDKTASKALEAIKDPSARELMENLTEALKDPAKYLSYLMTQPAENLQAMLKKNTQETESFNKLIASHPAKIAEAAMRV